MKNLIFLLSILFLFIIAFYNYKDSKNLENIIKERDESIKELWVEKLDHYQFYTMVRNDDLEYFKQLNSCLEIIKNSIRKEIFSTQEIQHLIGFSKTYSKIIDSLAVEEILRNNAHESHIEIVKKISEHITPFAMTGDKKIDFEFFRSAKNCPLTTGDTAKFVIMKYLDGNSERNRYSFIPSKFVKIIHPSIAEITYIVPAINTTSHQLNYNIFDTKTKDTLEKSIIINCN